MAEKNSDLVEITVPRGEEKDEKNLLISVNGKNYILPRGKKSKVPSAVAYEYQRSVRAKDRLYETKEQLIGASAQ